MAVSRGAGPRDITVAPTKGWHAIQMELAQATYCDEQPPWRYDPVRADRLRGHLTQILTDLTEWRPA